MIQLVPEVGDIFTTRATGIAKWALGTLIDPPTDNLHYGFLWLRRPWDWITLESRQPKGMYPGKLSWNDPANLRFYRVDCDLFIRHQAPYEALDLVTGMYDFLLVAKFVLEGGWLLAKHLFTEGKIRRLRPSEFHYTQNTFPVCTEAVVKGYDGAGFHVIPPGMAPLPNAFREAELAGRIFEYQPL